MVRLRSVITGGSYTRARANSRRVPERTGHFAISRRLVLQPQQLTSTVSEVPHADHHRLLPGLPGHLLPCRGRPRRAPAGRGQPGPPLHRGVLLRQAQVLAPAPGEPQPRHPAAAARRVRVEAGRLGGGAGPLRRQDPGAARRAALDPAPRQQRQHGADVSYPPARLRPARGEPRGRRTVRQRRDRRLRGGFRAGRAQRPARPAPCRGHRQLGPGHRPHLGPPGRARAPGPAEGHPRADALPGRRRPRGLVGRVHPPPARRGPVPGRGRVPPAAGPRPHRARNRGGGLQLAAPSGTC